MNKITAPLGNNSGCHIYIITKHMKGGLFMYYFKSVKGHIEVYLDGEFLFSSDNIEEAYRDVEAHKRGEL